MMIFFFTGAAVVASAGVAAAAAGLDAASRESPYMACAMSSAGVVEDGWASSALTAAVDCEESMAALRAGIRSPIQGSTTSSNLRVCANHQRSEKALKSRVQSARRGAG